MRQSVTTKDDLTQLNSCTIDFPKEEEEQQSNTPMDVDMSLEFNYEAVHTHDKDSREMITDEELNINTNVNEILNTNIPKDLLYESKEDEKATRYVNIVDIPLQLPTPTEPYHHDPVTTATEPMIENEQ
ncbi:hypothetical protein ABG067_008676, partial [Albugo candida]